MEDLDRRIGARIAAIREDQDFSQAEFSEELRAGGLNWSQGTLSKVESGQRAVRLAEAKVLSEILDLPLNLMFREPDYLADRSKAVRTEFESAQARWQKSLEALEVAGLRWQAVRLLEALRAGDQGPFKVHNCTAMKLLRFVTGEMYTVRTSEVRALLRSLNQGAMTDDLHDEAEDAVNDWLNDPEAVPAQFGEAFDRTGEGYQEYWLMVYEQATEGDADAFSNLVEEEFESRLAAELDTLFMAHGMEFIPPFNERYPTKIEGLSDDV